MAPRELNYTEASARVSVKSQGWLSGETRKAKARPQGTQPPILKLQAQSWNGKRRSWGVGGVCWLSGDSVQFPGRA